MSFVHGKTQKKYFSVREKINYYNDVLNGKVKGASKELKEKAVRRLPQLEKINKQSYSDPKIIVTDDKHFGNGISKPRLCVAVGEDNKHRILVAPILSRTTNTIVLDQDFDHQVSDRPFRLLDKNDVYERKAIDSNVQLTKYDKAKIKRLFNK